MKVDLLHLFCSPVMAGRIGANGPRLQFHSQYCDFEETASNLGTCIESDDSLDMVGDSRFASGGRNEP